MRSTRVLVVVLGLAACKDDAAAPTASRPGVVVTATPPPAPEEETVALPATFPLPAAGRRLVRSADRLGTTTWVYRYAAGAAEAMRATIAAGLQPVEDVDGLLVATHAGRRYAVAVQPDGDGVRVTVHAYPAGGPPTTPAPAAYPAGFPFVAGGTASHAGSGELLRVAYRQPAPDVEAATLIAAHAAGWQCTRATAIACTHGAQRVELTVEAAVGGSVLIVAAK